MESAYEQIFSEESDFKELNPVVYDKDNLYHYNFLFSFFKLKCLQYGVDSEIDKNVFIQKVGEITPAIITSTSFSAGASFIELIR